MEGINKNLRKIMAAWCRVCAPLCLSDIKSPTSVVANDSLGVEGFLESIAALSLGFQVVPE